MATQQQIADHLGITQQAVAKQMDQLGIDWRQSTLDEIRLKYLDSLRAQASGHQTSSGESLIAERIETEKVDRALKLLILAEKRGLLVNVAQLEPELINMVGAFKAELLARDDKLKTELDALYGINLDVSLLNEHTRSALQHFARYYPSDQELTVPNGSSACAIGADQHNGVVTALSPS
ncbi:MarR family transcriptional regulator [Parvibium lacunae]|uniref:MarR family transcriptional regulator n=1 Tax=Parvibium lacunae TaxID=1888893 RepID=UPI001864729E|nr:MarR family transcriptional regulator [Parvibium lacunae]